MPGTGSIIWRILGWRWRRWKIESKDMKEYVVLIKFSEHRHIIALRDEGHLHCESLAYFQNLRMILYEVINLKLY